MVNSNSHRTHAHSGTGAPQAEGEDKATKYSSQYPTHLGDAEGPSTAVSTEPQGLAAPRAAIKRMPKSGPGGYNGYPD